MPPERQASGGSAITGDWPQWRGPDRSGVADGEALASGWSEDGPKVLWRRSLGEGYSGIVVSQGVVYTLLADSQREYLIALLGEDGSELWRADLGPRFESERGHGPRSTPAISKGLIVALSGRGRLVAVAARDGSARWRRDMVEPPQHGYASSPLIDDGQVILHGRFKPGESVVALDLESGELRWSVELGEVGYASPLAVMLQGRRQILSFSGDEMTGLAAESGEILWSFPWPTRYAVNAADPIFVPPDGVFLSSSYDMGGVLLRFGAEAGSAPTVAWKSRAMKNHFNSSVLSGEYLYGFDNSTLRCVQLADGEPCWRQRGFGKGSLVRAGTSLLVLGDDGTLVQVEANPEAFRELGRVEVLNGRSWTPPSLAGNHLLIRDRQEIVCLELP